MQARTKAMIRNKKRAHKQKFLEEMKLHRQNNKTGKFFQEIIKTRHGFRPRTGTVFQNEQGKLTSEKGVVDT